MVKTGLMVSLSLVMTLSQTYGQSLLSARAVALGIHGAFVNDTRGFTANPAGLVGIRDWEFTTSTYTARSADGFVFHGLTFGKRFLDDEAVAFQYSPGSLIEFIVPSGVSISTGDSVVSLDQKISYTEDFAFGFAHRFAGDFAMGISARMRQEKVTDTEYRLLPHVEIVSQEYSSRITFLDLSAMWKPLPSLSVAGIGRNLLRLRGDDFPAHLDEYRVPETRSFELSVRQDFSSTFSAGATGSTQRFGALGYELRLPDMNLVLRNSFYLDKEESPFAYAFAAGVGWAYEFLEVDVSYLGFFNRSARAGSRTVQEFSAAELRSLDLNAYTKERLTLSVKAIFGNVRESLVRIQSVEVLGAVYPSSYELFAFRPIGKVKVRNVSAGPVEAKARFFIEKYMDAPTETPSVHLQPGEEKEIPFSALLNEQIRQVTKLTIREGNVYVSAAPDQEFDDRMQTTVLIHGRNDWNGDVHTLRHFVTPDDPDVLRYTRDILLQHKDSLAAVPRGEEAIAKARILFNAFAGKLVYVGDPKQSADYVQYPSETLAMKSGDCDDMTVCFSSLLSSVGISTAFIDVVPPEAPEKSHIYMMFDTGLAPEFGPAISANPKRYIVRRNPKGEETLWLPVEPTVITKGFEAAWSAGAQEYLHDVEIQLGLVKGWVRIVDVN